MRTIWPTGWATSSRDSSWGCGCGLGAGLDLGGARRTLTATVMGLTPGKKTRANGGGLPDGSVRETVGLRGCYTNWLRTNSTTNATWYCRLFAAPDRTPRITLCPSGV